MKLTKQDIVIVTVNPSGAKRQLINTSLRSRGYTEVSGVPDFKTVVEILETAKIDWLICPLGDSDTNALQILSYVTTNHLTLDLRISLLLSNDEIMVLGKAFDLGLLSYHVGLETKDHVETAFNELFDLVDRYSGKQDLVAAHYIRCYLRDTKQIHKLLSFEKQLLKLNPGQADLLASMAESNYLCGKHGEAVALWRQTLAVNPSLEERVRDGQVACGYSGEENQQTVQSINVLGIERCIVIDPNVKDLKIAETFLTELGVPDIKVFSNPESVFDFIKSKLRIDIIIFEWSFPTLEGPILVQKLRDLLGISIPLTVINKDLMESDMPILREMGVTDRIRKPLVKENFLQDIIWIINQDRCPTEPFMILQKLIYALKEKNQENIALLQKKYIENEKVNEADRLYVKALVAYNAGYYLVAKEAALNSLKLMGNSLDALNILGKAMMKLREFEAALRCLENAQMMSPKNVERICRIAEAHLENGDDESYKDSLEEAMLLDEDHTAVHETKVKGALKHHNENLTKQLMSKLDSLEEIVSYTNNRAVALIRTQSFEAGIRLYQNAIASIPEDRMLIRNILAYNLSLGFIRTGSEEKAYELLKDLPFDLESSMGKRIKSLKTRLAKSLKDGETFKLKPPKVDTLDNQKEKLEELSRQGKELLESLKVSPGQICCHKIFFEPKLTKEVNKFFIKKIELKPRSKELVKSQAS